VFQLAKFPNNLDVILKDIPARDKKAVLAIKKTDPVTFDHVCGVVETAYLIADNIQKQGIKIDMTAVVHGALLHDIGKCEIDPTMLHSPAWLNDEERRVMSSHVQLTADYMEGKNNISPLAKDVAIYHHEKLSGGGTYGVKQLPIEVSIVSVADVFDALTKYRSYKDAMEPEEAIAKIKKDTIAGDFPERVAVALEKVNPKIKGLTKQVVDAHTIFSASGETIPKRKIKRMNKEEIKDTIAYLKDNKFFDLLQLQHRTKISNALTVINDTKKRNTIINIPINQHGKPVGKITPINGGVLQ
jgi:putative nucleotidyltransferase with HDIG domain